MARTPRNGTPGSRPPRRFADATPTWHPSYLGCELVVLALWSFWLLSLLTTILLTWAIIRYGNNAIIFAENAVGTIHLLLSLTLAIGMNFTFQWTAPFSRNRDQIACLAPILMPLVEACILSSLSFSLLKALNVAATPWMALLTLVASLGTWIRGNLRAYKWASSLRTQVRFPHPSTQPLTPTSNDYRLARFGPGWDIPGGIRDSHTSRKYAQAAQREATTTRIAGHLGLATVSTAVVTTLVQYLQAPAADKSRPLFLAVLPLAIFVLSIWSIIHSEKVKDLSERYWDRYEELSNAS